MEENKPIIIIIKPQLGENIGAIARIMKNFNIYNLRIVSPRDGWPNQKAISVSSGAAEILDYAQIFENYKEACKDLNYVFATTIRERNLTKKVFTPIDATEEACTHIESGEKVGFIFGPENFGLSNEIIAFSNSIISIPVCKTFSSINLSQSVGIILYEWFKKTNKIKSHLKYKKTSNLSKKEDIGNLLIFLKKELSNNDYFWPENKVYSLKENIDNLFSNLSLTDKDIKTFYGIFKNLKRK
tara:strand:- start:235 stop:960 length:726 start_codon:yes stop_codon:yes gene_type:complete